MKILGKIRYTKKDDWRGHRFKEREVKNAIRQELGSNATDEKVEAVFELVKNQRDY